MLGTGTKAPAKFANHQVLLHMNHTPQFTLYTTSSCATHVVDGWMAVHRGGHIGYDDSDNTQHNQASVDDDQAQAKVDAEAAAAGDG